MFENILAEIRRELANKKLIKTIILFGSVARGEAVKGSDIDLLIVMSKRNKRMEENISNKILQIDKKCKANIQYIVTDEKFEHINKQFLDTILREGIVIHGKIPAVSIQKLDLEPYSLIKYSLSQLQHSEKMKIKRILFGKETKKKYKGRVYVSKKKGYLEEYKGIKTGIASILIPEKYAKKTTKELRKYGAKVRVIPAWLQKV